MSWPAERLILMERASSGAPPPRAVLSGQACVLGIDDGSGLRHVQCWANGHLVRWAPEDDSVVPDLWVCRPWHLEAALLAGAATPRQLAAGSTYGRIADHYVTTYPACLLQRTPSGEAGTRSITTTFWLADYPLGPLPVTMATYPDGSATMDFAASDAADLVVEGATTDLVRLLLGRLELPDLGGRAAMSGDVLLAGAVLPIFTDGRYAAAAADALTMARSVEEYLCALAVLDQDGWRALLGP